jgi:hypothetical protein
MTLDRHSQEVNSENFKLFVKRGPVNFSSPRALRCQLNSQVLPLLARDEAQEMIAATRDTWPELMRRIGERLRHDGKIL